MADYVLVGSKNDEVPTYMVSATTYALSDSDLNADMEAKGVGAPAGTLIAKPGFSAIKQRGLDGSWTEA